MAAHNKIGLLANVLEQLPLQMLDVDVTHSNTVLYPTERQLAAAPTYSWAFDAIAHCHRNHKVRNQNELDALATNA